ncbi:MAG: hypothetical protein KUA35_15025 [Pseudodesulfovibrio sp.]|nr:hypothetical protein [Pseudodesulfovibrio sp.]
MNEINEHALQSCARFVQMCKYAATGCVLFAQNSLCDDLALWLKLVEGGGSDAKKLPPRIRRQRVDIKSVRLARIRASRPS